MSLDFSLEFDREETISLLKELLSDAEKLNDTTSKVAFSRWHERTTRFLSEYFTSNEVESYFVKEADLSFSIYFYEDRSEEDSISSFDLPKARKAVRRIIKGVEGGSAPPQKKRLESQSLSDKVFVVHGHDEALKAQVARTVSDMKLQPVILSEQPNKGQTIIEKFEENSDVGFAVVLMTGDDQGASNSDVQKGKLKQRARQNVILELGYFYGRLGRDRVFVLKEPDVEEPSDILGVVYQAADAAGFWKFALGKELKAVGYDVDLNTL